VRLGSLKRAADTLSITPAAVGQRVKALEDYLGINLLLRRRSGLQPTPELLTALGSLSSAFRELDTAADLLNLQRRDEIHIAATSDFAAATRLITFAQSPKRWDERCRVAATHPTCRNMPSSVPMQRFRINTKNAKSRFNRLRLTCGPNCCTVKRHDKFP